MTARSAEHVAALSLDLKHEPLPAEQVLLGNPSTATHELEDLAGCSVGVWEMTPGKAVDTETEEVFVVLSGSASIAFLDENYTLNVGKGDIVRLRAGQRTVWTVTETLRKVYFTGE